MKKFTLFLLIMALSCFAWATTYYVSPSGLESNDGQSTGNPWPLQYALDQASDGDTIQLMSGTYYPPLVNGESNDIGFTDYWNSPQQFPVPSNGTLQINKTVVYPVFNTFIVPGIDITIQGTGYDVSFERNTTNTQSWMSSLINTSDYDVTYDITPTEREWQFGFVFFDDGLDDGEGVSFKDFEIDGLDYGIVNSWAFTENYFENPTTSHMENSYFKNIVCTDITQSGFVLEPSFHYDLGNNKNSNNTDLFSTTNFDWAHILHAKNGNNVSYGGNPYEEDDAWKHDFPNQGYGASECEINNCEFDNILNKAMVNVNGVVVNVHDCTFDTGWRGFHLYGGGSASTWDESDTVILQANTFLNFDGVLYPGISENPPTHYNHGQPNDELIDNPNWGSPYQYSYWKPRCAAVYSQNAGLDIPANLIGNYYEANNGAVGIYTDSVVETSQNETYNYTGSAGWIKDIHNVGHNVTLQNCNFYIYDQGWGVTFTKMDKESTVRDNPSDEEEYSYNNSDGYGNLNAPVHIIDCNFYGINTVHNTDKPGSGSGIFLADWEHYERDTYGTSSASRNTGNALYLSGCIFQDLYAGIILDSSRPDQCHTNQGGDLLKHDDGRNQIYADECKFISCDNSVDFSLWDQWIRTNSFAVFEDCYFGTSGDPYNTFNFADADNFPMEDTWYDLDQSYFGSTTYIYGDEADQRYYSGSHGQYFNEDGTEDNYHVNYPQYLQYLPYYTDEAMTELSGLEVENVTITRADVTGEDYDYDYTLTWTRVSDDQAKYMVYSSTNPYSGWDSGTEVAAGTGVVSTVINSSETELYFKIAVLVPNRCKSDGKFYGYTTKDPEDLDFYEYSQAGIPMLNHPLYNWPSGWDFPVDYWDDANSTWYYTDDNAGTDRYGIATVDWVYNDDASYNVSKAGSKEISLDLEGTNYYLIALPFEGDYATGDDLFEYLNLTPGTDVVSAWDEVTQGWESSSYNTNTATWDIPFGAAEVNGVYMITATTTSTGENVVPIDVMLTGELGESPVYNILETQTTDLNFIMVPYDFTGTKAEDLGDDMGTDNTIMISKWDTASQSWISCVYISGIGWLNSFDIDPGMPVVVGAVQDFTWPNN